MISSRREDRTLGAASAEAPARPLLRDQFRPHRRQTFHPRARRRRAARRGYGECVAEQDPYYSSETNDTAWHIITEFIAPRVLGVEFAHPRELFPALKAIRGHNMAKAAVEMAAWDLFAKQRGEPLRRVLGGTRERIASGVSIGIQRSLDELVGESGARARRRLPPHQDQDQTGLGSSRRCETVRARFGADPADGGRQRRLPRSPTPTISRSSIGFDLMMIEQPLDYDDIADHAALQRRLKTPICLDESIKTVGSRREAIAARRLPHHQHQAGARRRLRRVDPPARSVRGARHSGLAWRHARVGHRPRRQRASVDAAEFHAAGRHRRQQPLFRSGSDRPADRGGCRRHDRGADGAGHRRHHPRRSHRASDAEEAVLEAAHA